MAQQYPNSGFGTNGATTNSFLANYGNKNGFLDSFAKKNATPTQNMSTPAPNMSTNAGPAYAAPQSGLLGGQDPTVKNRTEISPAGTKITETYFDPNAAKPKTGSSASASAPATPGAAPGPGLQRDANGNPILGSMPTNPDYQPGQKYGTITSDPLPGESQGAWEARMAKSSGTPSSNVNPNQSFQYAGTGATPGAPTRPTTFPGFIGALGQTAQQGNPQAQQAAAGLLERSSQPSQQYTDAYNNAKGYNDQLAQSMKNQAGAEAQNRLNPIPLGDQTGREAVIQSQYLKQQQALGAGFQGASTLISGANTQQQNQISALNNAGALGNQSQGLVQSGLTSGATATAPQLGSIGQVPFSPVNGSQGSPLGAPGGTAADAAKVLGGFQGAQAAAAAPGQAQASNTQTTGTTQTKTYADQFSTYAGQETATNTALNQVQSLGQLTLDTAQGGKINPFTIAAGNSTLAELRRQLSSPAQGQFDQTMATFQGSLSQLFANSSDVTPTQVGAWATQISNSTMPVQTLQAIYNQAIKEGTLKLGNITSAKNYAQSQMQAGSTNNSNSNANTTTANPWH